MREENRFKFLWWVDIKLCLCWCQPWRQQGIPETGHTASLGSEPKLSGDGFEYTFEKVHWNQVHTLVEPHVDMKGKSLKAYRAQDGSQKSSFPVFASIASSLSIFENLDATRRKRIIVSHHHSPDSQGSWVLLVRFAGSSSARQRCNNLPHLANCDIELSACLHLTAAGTD